MKLPLTFDRPTLPNCATVIYDDESGVVAHVFPKNDCADRFQRATQIVRAVNAHQALVEALRPFAAYACDISETCGCHNCRAVRAIKLAEQS